MEDLQYKNTKTDFMIALLFSEMILAFGFVATHNITRSKAPAITTTFIFDGSWTKGGWK